MTRCPSCRFDATPGSRFCGSCGAPLTDSRSPTEELESATAIRGTPPQTQREDTSVGRSRFSPGTVLKQRYRIIELIGRGGMGELYRAEDLSLGQPVALKFLPGQLTHDPRLIERVRDEVRLARQVSHPNVCRVHDIGETDGQVFISMEYIDGEDLASLLYRIGRLSGDKAKEVAQQICAGLAAAHAAGVLHRDLKPANIMLDKQGRARITDFGLAVPRGEASEAAEPAGTPAYMAPEQLAGVGVSEKSDIYSLGLVLYELFTSQRALKGGSLDEIRHTQRSLAATAPVAPVPEMDPHVHKIIMRCLAVEAEARPSSVLTVLTTLLGGDAVEAAVIAGLTPSPQMVAATPRRGALTSPVAWICLAGIAVSLLVMCRGLHRVNLVELSNLTLPPAALASRAREILGQLSPHVSPVDEAFGFAYESGYLTYLDEHDDSAEKWKRLAIGQPAAVRFWYRVSPRHLVATNYLGEVLENDPPHVAGELSMVLDSRGRLLRFAVMPSRTRTSDVTADPIDWQALFALADLRIEKFRTRQPTLVPPVVADTGAAWEGVYPDSPDVDIQVEAAAFEGHPVYFEIIEPWRHPIENRRDAAILGDMLGLLETLLLVIGAFLAWRNLRAGSGDTVGAIRLATFVLILDLLHWLVFAHHVPSFGAEMGLFTSAAGSALYRTAKMWIFYLALEPYARRLWPSSLVSWARLLGGHLRDPMVARDILLGLLATAIVGALVTLLLLLFSAFSARPPIPLQPWVHWLMGGRYSLSAVLIAPLWGIRIGLVCLLLLLLLRVFLNLRRTAMVAFFVIVTVTIFGYLTATIGSLHTVYFLAAVLLVGSWAMLLTRFGFLATAAAVSFGVLGIALPAPSNLSSWPASNSLLGLVIVFVVTIYGLSFSTAGQNARTGEA